jgi:hypothetical protein
MLQYRIKLCLFSTILYGMSFAVAQNASADTINSSLTGYTFMGGASAYTSTEASHSKTYFLSGALNSDYYGANYYGYGWVKFADIGTTEVESAVLYLNLLGVGSMSTTPASATNSTVLNVFSSTTDVAVIGGNTTADQTLRTTLCDTLDAITANYSVTITADGLVGIDITDLYNAWVSGELENNGLVLACADNGAGGKFSSFGDTAGTPYVVTTAAVPEPSTVVLFGVVLVGIGISRILHRRKLLGTGIDGFSS